MVTYYIILKQKAIIQGFQKMLKTLRTSIRTDDIDLLLISRRFHRLNRDYVHLSNELRNYQSILQYYVSVLLNFYSLLIVYLTYLVFLDHPPLEVLLYCSIVLACHVIALAMLLRCSSVDNYDRRILKLAQQFQFQLSTLGLSPQQQQLKIDSLVLGIERARLTFRTLDGKVLDSHFSLQILFNVAKYFFLFFKY